MPRKIRSTDHLSLQYLLGASALSLALSFVPMARMLVYPFRLFVTFIHEGGHALAALLTLGKVESVSIYVNASGETLTRGGVQPFIASAGYLASTIFGASLLMLCRRGSNTKAALTVTAGIILALTAFYAGDPFSWAMGIFIAIALILVVIAAGPRFAHFFLSFLAVQCCLNALFDLDTLFWLTTRTNAQNDAVTMQQLTFIPAAFWAAAWMFISVVALILALRSYARSN